MRLWIPAFCGMALTCVIALYVVWPHPHPTIQPDNDTLKLAFVPEKDNLSELFCHPSGAPFFKRRQHGFARSGAPAPFAPSLCGQKPPRRLMEHEAVGEAKWGKT